MSRSGYTDDGDENWSFIMYRGAVKSAFRGKRGQAFMREMLAAMDALPVPVLIRDDLEQPNGAVCAIGAVGKARGVDMAGVDPDDIETVAGKFGIAEAMAREIVWENDEVEWREGPIERFARMRAWVQSQIIEPKEIKEPSPDAGALL